MTTALAERDDITVDGEVVEAAPRAPMTLFGTDDPAAVVERASAVATSLASVIDERRLFATISGKKHVQVEGWTLLGSMLGVFAEIQWSRQLDNGWEARAVARTLDGRIVGAAEAMCSSSEGRWRSADDHAIRSMAQTRAVSKALRLPLGFIMHLAGYSATPAEELVEDQPQEGERSPVAGRRTGSRTATTRPAVQRTPEEQALVDELTALPGMSRAQEKMLADLAGVEKGTRANADQLRAMLARARQPASGVPAAPAEAGGEGSVSPPPNDSDAAVVSPPAAASGTPTDEELLAAAGPGAEIVPDGSNITMRMSPPAKPGTAEYKAYPAQTKAAARAYWQEHKDESVQETLAEAMGAPTSD